MSKEFTKLSEVSLIQEVSENTNVLVEENGEIRRVPKTQVGGAGSEPDMVIEIINESTYEIDDVVKDDVKITTGDIGEIIDMIENGHIPNIEVILRLGNPTGIIRSARIKELVTEAYYNYLSIRFPICLDVTPVGVALHLHEDYGINGLQVLTPESASNNSIF